MNALRVRHLLPILLLGLAGCSQPPTPVPTPAATPLPPVALVRTGEGPITASANVVPAQSADLAFATAGQLTAIAVAVGDLAPAGTLLLALDDGDAQGALAQAQAAYFRAQALQAQVLAEPTDPALAAAQAQLDAAQARLDQLAESLPQYFSTPEMRLDCPEDKKFLVPEELKKEFGGKYKVIDIDGARVEFGDGWGLVRASNTQPAVVVRFEARTAERLAEIEALMMAPLARLGVGAAVGH